jgi:hypothetical protein
MAMAAALSAAHLAAILFPETLRRLYIVRDNDPAGDGARRQPDRTGERGRDRGDRAVAGARGLQRGSPAARHRRAPGRLRVQLAPQDVARFMAWRHSRKGLKVAAARRHARPDASCLRRRGPRLGLREGDRPSAGPARQWLRPTIFRRGAEPAPFHREAK